LGIGGQRARSGYTVVEVMIALAVLTVGAIGVVGMQKSALLGNVRGRNLATATTIAGSWIERLRADAAQWTDYGDQPNVEDTRWLAAVEEDFPAMSTNEFVWLRPAPDIANNISPQADARGMDTFDDSEAAFCTHIRLTQLLRYMIRAEVRVFWLRRDGGGTINGQLLCSADAGYITGVSTEIERYHYVYLASAILRTEIDTEQ